jgi:hypothetical protein
MARQNKNSVTVSVTLPREIREAIQRLAVEGRRSFSNEVALLLEDQLKFLIETEANP